MKRLAIILVLAILVLASGCSYYRAKKAEKEGYEQLERVQAQADEMQKQMATTTKAMQQTQQQAQQQAQQQEQTRTYQAAPEEDEPETYSVATADGGETVGFQKLGTQYRTKDATERCDLDQPFSCMSYVASEGRVDITLKYLAYAGMVKEVALYLNGDKCDPPAPSIEPGKKQAYTCYADESGDQLRGSLEVEYYESLKKANMKSTGTIVANWE